MISVTTTFRALVLMIVVVSALACGARASGDDTRIDFAMETALTGDKILFFAGKRIIDVEMRYDAASDVLVVNGDTLVNPVIEAGWETAKGFTAVMKAKYVKVPLVKEALAAGVDTVEAVRACLGAEQSIGAKIEVFLLEGTESKDIEDLVSLLRVQTPIDKVVRGLELIDGKAAIEFFSSTAPVFMSKEFSEMTRNSRKHSTAYSAGQTIKSFLIGKSRQLAVLIIDGKGNSALMKGKTATEALTQIEATAHRHEIVEGPCSAVLLADFVNP